MNSKFVAAVMIAVGAVLLIVADSTGQVVAGWTMLILGALNGWDREVGE